jgi:hypothetical protein
LELLQRSAAFAHGQILNAATDFAEGIMLLLTFPALSADGVYLCVNVGHRELIEPLPLSVILDVFQPVWSRGQGLHEIGHAHDEHGGLAVPLNQETVVVFNSPSHDLTEPASDSGSGDFAGHGPAFRETD